MSISKETQEKINLLFKNNPKMIERLYNCDAEAIREIGSISQRGINPDDIVVAYESGEQDTINYLYRQAKRLIELQELYKDLCFEYYKKVKDKKGNLNDVSSYKTNVKR
jgi:hypothetical protein